MVSQSYRRARRRVWPAEGTFGASARLVLFVGVFSFGACGGSGEPLLIDDPCWQTPAGGGLPVDLRCTGLYSDWAAKTVAPDVQPFAPGTPLWSDGARKQRWIHLPAGATIDTSNPDEWVFPVGTKAWKEFSLGGRKVETRLFQKVSPERWLRTTYLWAADGSGAQRRDRGVANFEGTGYSIPSVSDCDKCHEGRVDRLLGFEAISLAAADELVPAGTQVTLSSLIRRGQLSAPPPPTAVTLPAAIPAETRAAVSWLHVNCGVSCHNRASDSTAMATQMFLRLEAAQVLAASAGDARALDAVATTVGVPARIVKWSGSLRITPGSPIDSLLFRLATSRGNEQMPPLLSHIPDPDGTRVLRTWITALGQVP